MRVLLCLLALLTFVDASAQCSMCRAVLESGADLDTAKGINNGIIHLMAIPYLLVGFVGYQIFKLQKKDKIFFAINILLGRYHICM